MVSEKEISYTRSQCNKRSTKQSLGHAGVVLERTPMALERGCQFQNHQSAIKGRARARVGSARADLARLVDAKKRILSSLFGCNLVWVGYLVPL